MQDRSYIHKLYVAVGCTWRRIRQGKMHNVWSSTATLSIDNKAAAMARGVNKVILIGHLGKDPVISYADDGSEIAQFSLATTQSWKDKQTGEARERTEWHRIVIFGPLAKVASQYLRKGSKAYLEGYLQTRKWQDQVGLDHYTTEIILDAYDGKMQLLDSARNEPPLHGHIEKPSASSTTPGSSGEIGYGDEEPINDKIESTTIPPSDITPQD